MKYPTAIILGLVLFLSGCTKYGPWFKKKFKTAELCTVSDELKVARGMLRREPIYEPNSWKTVDIIYAIPMNTLVTKVDDQLNCCGGNRAIAQQNKTEKPQTRFYVLMDGAQTDWCYVLSVPGRGTFKASTVKSRDLNRGLKGILGDNLRFKKSIYELYFDVVVGAAPCDLVVSNGTYTATLSWECFES